MKRYMKHIKDCLPKISASNNNQNWKLHLMNQWETIMGSIGCKVSIYKIYNDSITLGVCDSGWMQELYLLSNLIKQKINSILDKTRIETIRFQYVTKTKCPNELIINKEQIEKKDRLLTNIEKKALEKITDPELYKALSRLLQQCHQ